MCKILVLTNMSKIKDLDKSINVICENLSKTEGDGIGYAIQGESGLFGERSLNTKNFKTDFKKTILDFNFLAHDYNRIGKKSKVIGGGIFHGRTSTNDKTLLNTHPIQKHGLTLIHNGVVSDHGPDYNMITTNDTEHLLERFSQGIESIEQFITGYYALAAFDASGKLHILRDNIATLYFGYIKKIDSYIIGTTKSLIEQVCSAMSWQVSILSLIKDNSHIVLNNNKIESFQSFKPRGRTYEENKKSMLSLGYDLNEHDSKLSDDEKLFLEEVNLYSDASYQFFDYRNNPLTFQDFKRLSDDEKLNCIVVRPDGTIVDQVDYAKESLYYNY